MTLLIAKRHLGKVSLTSDSRFSLSTNVEFDFGIKIFSIPVRVFSPRDSDNGAINLEHEFRVGMGIVGNTTNAFTVKEAICEILQNLQFIPGVTDISIQSIANLVGLVYEKVSKSLTYAIRDDGVCELVLTGYCPVEKNIRVFNFHQINVGGEFQYTYKEILLGDGIEFYGLGKDAAKDFHFKEPSKSVFHIVKNVIDDPSTPSVGGSIQYGEFRENDFEIFGVMDYDLNEDGTFGRHLFMLRGLNMDRSDFNRNEKDFHVAYSYKMPFETEINKLLES